MSEKVKDSQIQETQNENQQIEVSEEIYNAIKEEVTGDYSSQIDSLNTQLSEKDTKIEELTAKLQEANRTRVITIAPKQQEVQKPKQEPKQIFI